MRFIRFGLIALGMFSLVCAVGKMAAGDMNACRDYITHALLFWIVSEVATK